MTSLTPPPLVHYQTEAEYYQHFCKVYCSSGNTILTFDGLEVDFYANQFKHAFSTSAGRAPGDKSVFSQWRAQRIDWIKWALENKKAELYQGWDNTRGRQDPKRRACIVSGNYVVIVQIKGRQRALFITAFEATPQTLQKIRSNPKWQ